MEKFDLIIFVGNQIVVVNISYFCIFFGQVGYLIFICSEVDVYFLLEIIVVNIYGVQFYFLVLVLYVINVILYSRIVIENIR